MSKIQQALDWVTPMLEKRFFGGKYKYAEEIKTIHAALKREQFSEGWNFRVEDMPEGVTVNIVVETPDGERDVCLGHQVKGNAFPAISNGFDSWWMTGMDFTAIAWQELPTLPAKDAANEKEDA